ncbi:MAG: LysR family transcriptional regulator [Phenylobacterium sp.]|uniref:LysR family transcriptional regulator n=1 Tax=Phenylobacterium sp. TaxID=1871053 RepID=UPI00120F26CB|nr:LysR family transcriptional regulator [Phenylobacterium sp.]TAJ73894.1 MAG: LysR family transcriptional regulator [Phenylobacterium sp.]
MNPDRLRWLELAVKPDGMSMPHDDEPDAYRLDAQLLSDLWIFRAAARLGSITAAARRLGVTQGAVSQRVLRLEARLGAPLFVRHKSRIALTDAGTTLLGAMTQVALVLNDSLSRINRLQRKAIVVSCVPSLATEWLVPHLDEFYRQHPGIEVFVRSELAPSTPERMEDDGIDLAIDYLPTAPADLHELASLQEMIFPVCAPTYRQMLAGPDADTMPIVLLHDDVPWIGGSAESEWGAWRKAAVSTWPDRATGARHFNLAHLAYHAAMGDQGVAVGRSVIVNRLLMKGELVAAVDRAPVPGPSYRVLTSHPGDARSPVRQFANWWGKAMAETQAQTLSLLTAEAGSGLAL